MSGKAEKKQAQPHVTDNEVLKTDSTLPDTGNKTTKMGGTDTGPRVYIGPDIPGAKQYTVFNNGLPGILKEKAKEKPFLNSLIIPVGKLAQANRELDKEGSALNILFKKAVKEIQEG